MLHKMDKEELRSMGNVCKKLVALPLNLLLIYIYVMILVIVTPIIIMIWFITPYSLKRLTKWHETFGDIILGWSNNLADSTK